MDSNISITQFRNHTAGRVFGSNGTTGAPEELTFSGLHVTAAALALGGALTENVAITGASGLYSFSMTQLGGFTIGTSSAAITASSTVAISSTSTFGITSGSSLTVSATTTMSFTAGGNAAFGTSAGSLTLSATTDLNFVFGTIKLNGTAASTPTTQFLRGDGTWGIPAGGGGGISDGDYGDITVSGSGTVWTIDNDVVTYAKMQNVSATARIMGRLTAGAGDMEELTGTQATTLLNVFTTSLKGLVPASGGGSANFLRADGNWAAPVVTASNGITASSGNVKWGGTLVNNTLVDGASFNLQFGTFLTSPLGNFSSYATSYFLSARDPGTGDGGALTLNSQAAFAFTGQAGRLSATQSTAQTADTTPLLLWTRLSANTNSPGLGAGWIVNTNGTAAAGFGVYDQWQLEVSDGSSEIAQQDELTWEVATAGAEYAQWRKLLCSSSGLQEVYKIETNTVIKHTFAGRVNMAGLPTSASGLSAGDLWNNSGVLSIA